MPRHALETEVGAAVDGIQTSAYKGIWNPNEDYVAGDMVLHDGKMYGALQPSTNLNPKTAIQSGMTYSYVNYLGLPNGWVPTVEEGWDGVENWERSTGTGSSSVGIYPKSTIVDPSKNIDIPGFSTTNYYLLKEQEEVLNGGFSIYVAQNAPGTMNRPVLYLGGWTVGSLNGGLYYVRDDAGVNKLTSPDYGDWNVAIKVVVDRDTRQLDFYVAEALVGSTVVPAQMPDNRWGFLSPSTSQRFYGLQFYAYGAPVWQEAAGVSLGSNLQTGTAYQLALTDAGSVVEMDNAAANTVTLPLDSVADHAIGTVIYLVQLGVGITTLSAAAGVTLNGTDGGSVALSRQHGQVVLRKRAANDWLVTGDW